MSQSAAKQQSRPAAPGGPLPGGETAHLSAPGATAIRVDAGHAAASMGEVFDGLPALPENEVKITPSPAALQRHAQDLAEQLQSRRRDLDLRETRLNRQLALFDQERQAARLARQEQEHSLQNRLGLLEKREQEVAEQMRRSAAAEEALRQEFVCARENLDAQRRAHARDSETIQREHERLRGQSAGLTTAQERLRQERDQMEREIAAARQALHLRRQQFEQNSRSVLDSIEAKRAALAAEAEQLARDKQNQAHAVDSVIETYRASLNRAEAEYLRLAGQVETELKDLADRRAAHEEDCRNERKRLLLERESIQAEQGGQRSELARRQAALEDAQAALQKAQAEFLDQQRTILEERLAVEQATQSLNRQHGSRSAEAIAAAREKLAEHYRWMKESLHAQKNDLLQIARQLDVREQAISEDRDALQQWVQKQQADLDAQQLQLENAREALNRREAEIDQRERRWALQRKGLEARLSIAQARAA